MNFAGDQVDGAQKVFSKFVSEPHDPKAAQLGEFVYVNGTVSPPTSSIANWSYKPSSFHSVFRCFMMGQNLLRVCTTSF